MSRRPKLDYDFCPVPRRRHAAWAGASLFETGLRDRLFELTDGGPITTDGPWEESLCKQAAVNGTDRSNARRALRKWRDRGLLSVDGAVVSIVFRHGESLKAKSQVTPASLAVQSEVTPGSVRGQSEVTFDSTPRNDSNHVGETDRQTDERERAPARAPARSIASRPDIIGFNFVASLLGRDAFSIAPLGSYPRQYTWIGSRPDTERTAVAKAVAADEWCVANPGHVDAAHLEKSWQKYLAGRPKPVAKTAHQPQLLAASGAYREL